MAGEVDVLGQYDSWRSGTTNGSSPKLQRDPFTDDDARALSEFGI
jgi:hypothetical protein